MGYRRLEIRSGHLFQQIEQLRREGFAVLPNELVEAMGKLLGTGHFCGDGFCGTNWAAGTGGVWVGWTSDPVAFLFLRNELRPAEGLVCGGRAGVSAFDVEFDLGEPARGANS